MPDDVDDALARLHQRVAELLGQGRYDEAIPYASQAVDVARRELGEHHRAFAWTLGNLGGVYRLVGDLAAAEPLLREALDLRQTLPGVPATEIADSLNHLGLLLERSGELSQAGSLFSQVVGRFSRTLGDDHPYVMLARSNLARVNQAQVAATASGITPANVPEELTTLYVKAEQLRAQGRYAEAIPLLERQCQLVPLVTGGEEHPIYARALADLADAHRLAGDPASAEPLLHQALDVYRRTLGETHPHVAVTAHNLGRLYLDRGDYPRAESLLRQAVDGMRHTSGEAHPNTGTALNDLGTLYLRWGKVASAEPLLKEALDVYRRTVGEEHPYFVTTRDTLAQLGAKDLTLGQTPGLERQIGRLHKRCERLRAQGRYLDAIPLVEQQLALTRQLKGGDEYPEVATVLNNLALLHTELADYASAEAPMMHALDITERTLGTANPEFANRVNNLGYLRRAMGDYAAALSLFERALATVRASSGDDHLDAAFAKNNLAGLHMAMGEYAKAEPLYRQALETRQRHLGTAHPGVAELLDNLGQLFFAIGDHAAAILNVQQALETYRRALGNDHPDVAVTLGNLALMHVVLGDHAAAEPLLAEALRINRAAFGERHPATAGTLSHLAGLYRSMRRYADAERQYEQAMAIERTVWPPDHPLLARNLHNLAALRIEMGNPVAAVPLLEPARWNSRRRRVARTTRIGRRASMCSRGRGRPHSIPQQRSSCSTGPRRSMTGRLGSSSPSAPTAADGYASEIWARCAFHLALLLDHADRRAAGNTGLDLVLRRKALVAESVAMQRTESSAGATRTWLGHCGSSTPSGRGSARGCSGARGPAVWSRGSPRGVGRPSRATRGGVGRADPRDDPAAADARCGSEERGGRITRCGGVGRVVRVIPFDARAAAGRGERQWGAAHYVAFVLAADAPDDVQLLDLGTADHVDGLVAAFRESITGASGRSRGARAAPDEPASADVRGAILSATRDVQMEPEEPDGTADAPVGAELRAALFDPLRSALGGRTRLVLAPDGDLNRLPFEVLPLDVARRVIDVYTISYAGTGRDVLRVGTATGGQPGAPVVAADPAFDLGAAARPVASLPFRQLAGTRAEGEQVAAMVGVQALLADAVLETPLKMQRAPGILHLATHGFFLPTDRTIPTPSPTDQGNRWAWPAASGAWPGGRLRTPCCAPASRWPAPIPG